MVFHQIQHLPLCPLPGCPHLVASAEQMFNILDKVFPPACRVGAKIVVCSVLLKKSRSVTVDTVGEGEKQIFLFNLQDLISESRINQFFEVNLRKL